VSRIRFKGLRWSALSAPSEALPCRFQAAYWAVRRYGVKMAQTETEQTLAEKVGTLALTLAAGWVAQKAVSMIWKGVTGNDAPNKPDDPELDLVQATVFAAVAAGTAVFAKRMAAKGASRAVMRIAARRAAH